MDIGLLIARLVFGLLMAVHGSQKPFGWFGGPGISGAAAFLERLGFRPGRCDAVLGLNHWRTQEVTAIVLAAGAVGACAGLGERKRTPPRARVISLDGSNIAECQPSRLLQHLTSTGARHSRGSLQ